MTRSRANLMLLLAALFWGVGNVAQKTVLEDLGPTLTFGLRCAIGLVVISPFLASEVRRCSPLSRSGLCGTAAAAVFFCLAIAVQQRAFAETSVTNASFLINTSVVFTPVFALVLLRERPRLSTIPAIVLALGGVLLMGGGLTGLSCGDGLCLVAAVLFSAWFVCVARVTHAVDRPFTLAATQFGVSALLGTGFGVVYEPASSKALMGAAPELLVLGVFSTGAAFTLQAIAQRATPATDAAVVASAESPFGAAAAALVLGEQVTSAGVAGAVLILMSVFLMQVPTSVFSGTRPLRPARW